MALERLRDPKTGRFVSDPNSAKNILPVIAENFKSIQSNIQKIVKIKSQEKNQQKFDESRARQQAYKARYQKPTKAGKITEKNLKESASNIFSGLFGIMKSLFAIIGVSGILSILKKVGIGEYILDFLKKSLSAIIDLVKKSFQVVSDVLKDSAVKTSLYNLVTSLFKFIGTIILATASLAVSLFRDNEILDTLKNVVVSVFKAIIEGIKASYAVISKLVTENWETIKQTTFDVFIEIKNALILSLKSIGSVISGGIDPRISSGLKEIFVESWNFVKEVFTTEFTDPDSGKKFTLLHDGLLWVAKMGALAAAWIVFGAWMKEKGKALVGMSFMDLKRECSSCMGVESPDFEPDRKNKPATTKPDTKPKTKPSWMPQWADRLIESGKTKITDAVEAVKSVAKRAWGAVTDFGAKLYGRASNLGNKIYGFLENGVKRFANVFRAILKSPAIQNKVLQKFGQKVGMEAMKRIATKLTVAAAGLASGGVVTAIMTVLAAADIVMLGYAFYEFMFVTTDGETEDGGYYPVLKAEIDKWLKDNPETTPTPAPVALPAQAPSATQSVNQTSSASPTPTPTSTSATSSSSAVTTPASATMPTAPRVTPSQTTQSGGSTSPSPSQDYPTNWSASPMGVPAGVAVEKRQVGGLGYGGVRRNTKGVIIHHTGGRGLDVAIQTLQSRKLSYHYLVDRNGKVVQILPDELMGWHAGKTNKKPEFDNSNTVSISMVAKDDSDVTPEQIAAASSLEAMLAKKYGFSKSNTFGHGEVSSAKHPKEGFTIASAIRSGTVDQALENISDKTMEGVKSAAKPSIETPQTSRTGEIIDTASEAVQSGLRMLEDYFLMGRPSFTDLSTTVIQSSIVKKPGNNVRAKEEESFKMLIQRQLI